MTTHATHATHATALDCHAADGVRRFVASVGVDSGALAIAAGDFPNSDELLAVAAVADNAVTATTGWGDGGYEVLALDDPTGQVVGVEVVFICGTAEQACEQALADSGIALDPAVLDRACGASATPSDRAAYAEYNAASQAVLDRVWPAAIAGADPHDSATAIVRGSIEVADSLGIGDPCYGGPSCTVPVPAGRYVAVTWMDDAHPSRVARLAVYRDCPRPPRGRGEPGCE